jgi:hypothetical protein
MKDRPTLARLSFVFTAVIVIGAVALGALAAG